MSAWPKYEDGVHRESTQLTLAAANSDKLQCPASLGRDDRSLEDDETDSSHSRLTVSLAKR